MTVRQFLPALILLAAGGCSAGSGDAKVSGKVTLDGDPVENGVILFTPSDGKGSAKTGEITNGQYTVNVPPGPKKVEITATKKVGEHPAYQDDPKSQMIPDLKEIIPAQYNTQSKLTFEVKPGTNDAPFELKTK